MTRPPEPTLRAIVLMYEPSTGGLTMQPPPEMPLEVVLHLLTLTMNAVDAQIRQQNNGLILPRKGTDGAN